MKTIVANWKMNLTIRESLALARGTLRAIQGSDVAPNVILCPSFTALAEVRKALSRTRMHVGAQDVGPDKSGAFTGAVSVSQLEDAGCSYVILGHSERRTLFHEDDALIAEKLKAVLASSLTPIICVGETAEVREQGAAETYVATQLTRALSGVTIPRRREIMVAYEPVWAIGSGNSPQPADVLRAHRVLKQTLQSLGVGADQARILYGGSVTGENAYSFLREPDIDGVLVGGASLKIHDIHAIIIAAQEVMVAQKEV